MTTTGFTITGQRELNLRLKALGQAPREMLRDVGNHTVEMARRDAPRKTSNLSRTIRIGSLSDTAVEVRAGGQNEVGYAAAVEFGTRPHLIRPKPGRVGRNGRPAALAWGGKRTLGGRLRAGATAEHYARSVRHPGTRPRPYLIPAFKKALALVGLDKFVKAWNGAA